ncbi:DUF4326 domain-containing protein [Novosphingobium mangrovi (ex Huang et al. 2023)]|uniref:DUF4326 domain-containing protein n=1 Tax=Novosphingobium mangrovi (ex Huang et al. 2023) TaxID=2976432 RepID=UPI003AF324F7
MNMIARGQRVRRRRGRLTRPPQQGVIYVGRPTLWGNPFTGRCSGHAKSIILHRRWLSGGLGALSLERMGFCPSEIESLGRLRERVLINLHRLAGKDLSCWCPLTSEWCHAETLLDMAPHYAQLEAHAA